MKRLKILGVFMSMVTLVCAQPKTADENYAVGLKLVKEEKLKEALPFFNKAITLNPKHVNAFTQAGLIFVRLQNQTDALTCLKTAIKLKKNISLEEINQTISSANAWVKLIPNEREISMNELSPASVSGKLSIPIGRIRKLNMGPEYISAFTVGVIIPILIQNEIWYK